jgi:flagellar motility protein MotE (MotC chaperone)
VTDDAEKQVSEKSAAKVEENGKPDEGGQETSRSSFKALLSRPIVLAALAFVLIGATAAATFVMVGSRASEKPAEETTLTGQDSIADSAATSDNPDAHAELAKSVDRTHKKAGETQEPHTPDQSSTEQGLRIQAEDLEEDPSVMEDIMANLAFLDYDPEELGMTQESGSEKISKEDSVAASDWLVTEKKRLSDWDQQLNTRQRELELLDKKVSRKVLRIEQAESARTTSLAKLYDNMDPRAVARLMANLDNNTVVTILPRMKQRNASQVMELMPAQRAAKLSKMMITIAGN